MREPEQRTQKRRANPWLIGCGSLGALLAASFAAYLVWANRLPPPEPDSRVLPYPNGFDACVGAAMKLAKTPSTGPMANPERATPAELRPLLARDRAALDEVREGLRLPYVTPALPNIAVESPYLEKFREAARRFSVESRVALAEGRPAEAVQRALDALDLGAHVGRGAPIIHNLAGGSCAAIGIAAAERCIPTLTAPEARAAGRRLDAIEGAWPSAADMFREERRLQLRSLRATFGGRPIDNEDGSARDRASVLTLYPKRWAYDSADRAMRGWIAEAEKPFPQVRPVPEPTELFASIYSSEGMWPLRGLVRLQAERRLLRLELALREYRALHGRFPDRLTELSPGLLAAIPNDPFTTRPFVYRRTAGGYLLYSFGQDGADDGGRPIRWGRGGSEGKGDLVAGRLYPPKPQPTAPGPVGR
jgi:hypothetical protein